MTDEFPREKRVIAYLDILGFKEATATPEKENQLIKILHLIRENNAQGGVEHQVLKEGDPNIPPNIKISGEGARINLLNVPPDVDSLSDSIIISQRLNSLDHIEGFSHPENEHWVIEAVTDKIKHFYKLLLPLGIALRGAISIGDVYYNKEKSITVGRSVIEAIREESKIAIYPRVILTQSYLTHWENPFLLYPFKQDFDGLYFLPIFNSNEIFIPDEITGLPIENPDFQAIRKILAGKITEHKDNLKIYSKWFWLFNKIESTHNLAVERLHQSKQAVEV